MAIAHEVKGVFEKYVWCINYTLCVYQKCKRREGFGFFILVLFLRRLCLRLWRMLVWGLGLVL